MRKAFFLVLAVTLLLLSNSTSALTPFWYNGIALDGSGEILDNQTVNVNISIYKGNSVLGSQYFGEQMTDQFGGFAVEINGAFLAGVNIDADTKVKAEVQVGAGAWIVSANSNLALVQMNSVVQPGNISLTEHHIIIGDASGNGEDVAIGGELTGTNTGGVAALVINNNAITNPKMADNAIGTAEIQDNAITNPKMADNAIGTAEIQDNAVTLAKLEHTSNYQFLIAYSGVPQWSGLLRNNSLAGDGISSALALNLANTNTWTAVQYLPANTTQGNNLIAAINTGTAQLVNGAVINYDATLKVTANELGINLANPNTWSGVQLLPANTGQGNNLIGAINTGALESLNGGIINYDSTLQVTANQLGINFYVANKWYGHQIFMVDAPSTPIPPTISTDLTNKAYVDSQTSSRWSMLGNAGLDPMVNFIGTTDDVDIVIKRNNKKSGKINSAQAETSLGYGAMEMNTTGEDNTAIGHSALSKVTTAMGNTAIGSKALKNATSSDNTAIGHAALETNNTGSKNTAVGKDSQKSNTGGSDNSSFGFEALKQVLGNNNTAIGSASMSNTTTGSNNTSIGKQAMEANMTGSNNTAIGSLANMLSAALSNVTVIGANAQASSSNQVRLGDDNITSMICKGAYAATEAASQPNMYVDANGQIKRSTAPITVLGTISSGTWNGSQIAAGYLPPSIVYDTELAAWGGSANINLVGTIATGTWNASPIIDAKVNDNLTINGGTISNTPITMKYVSDANGVDFTIPDGTGVAHITSPPGNNIWTASLPTGAVNGQVLYIYFVVNGPDTITIAGTAYTTDQKLTFVYVGGSWQQF